MSQLQDVFCFQGALPCCLRLALCLLLTAVPSSQAEWSSTYREPFSFQCQLGYSVANVRGVYSADNRDRTFSFYCSDYSLVSQRLTGVCRWIGQSNHSRTQYTHTHTHSRHTHTDTHARTHIRTHAGTHTHTGTHTYTRVVPFIMNTSVC